VRTIPAELQAALDTGCTTLTDIIRIDPVTPGYASFGITQLDADVTYDDGDGELVYLAAIGMDPSNISSSLNMTVDNSTSNHLLPEFDIPVSTEDIAAGVLDFAKWTRYRVNYNDLTPGRHIELGTGQLGEMKILQGSTFVSELTSIEKLLKTNIVEKDSITCRAQFGSQYIGTPDADITERFPCTKEYTWYEGTVTTPGDEVTNAFTSEDLDQATGFFKPGMVRWLTGLNAGTQSEVDEFTTGGVVDLPFQTKFPIQAGDTFEIRKDCTKWVYGANGCQEHWSSEAPDAWKGHYRGEPFIPIADADAINTPGATVGSAA